MSPRDLFGEEDNGPSSRREASPLRSIERGSPGEATARLDQLKLRFGAASDGWTKAPEMVVVEAPSGRETWWRIKGTDPARYRLEVPHAL